jgi:cyclophilin family peptidyl-prolyl cis-trans isomerase
MRKANNSLLRSREDNSIVFLDVKTNGGRKVATTGELTESKILGRMYFELRQDLLPITCGNFLLLISGTRGVGSDGIHYTYKNTKIHRINKNILLQGGDLIGSTGQCSKSIYNNGGVFDDENFLLRHTGPGILSMCNKGI